MSKRSAELKTPERSITSKYIFGQSGPALQWPTNANFNLLYVSTAEKFWHLSPCCPGTWILLLGVQTVSWVQAALPSYMDTNGYHYDTSQLMAIMPLTAIRLHSRANTDWQCYVYILQGVTTPPCNDHFLQEYSTDSLRKDQEDELLLIPTLSCFWSWQYGLFIF